uniref:Uncharacterized protein n=1 Tax=viral metagenome TaxID=1070528 RepID=A0A6M3KYP4_9ZZZZ
MKYIKYIILIILLVMLIAGLGNAYNFYKPITASDKVKVLNSGFPIVERFCIPEDGVICYSKNGYTLSCVYVGKDFFRIEK